PAAGATAGVRRPRGRCPWGGSPVTDCLQTSSRPASRRFRLFSRRGSAGAGRGLAVVVMIEGLEAGTGVQAQGRRVVVHHLKVRPGGALLPAPLGERAQDGGGRTPAPELGAGRHAEQPDPVL